MTDFDVYGLPLTLHMAQDKAAAIQLLNDTPDLAMNLALAIVDVVMETDAAGLALCNHIREEVGNRSTQIFIRTGQPGLAPEMEVIDRYEINGYFTKIEATEQKLYSLVKSGVRQFLWSYLAHLYLAGFNGVLRSADRRQKVEQVLHSFVGSAPGVSNAIPLYTSFDGDVLVRQAIAEEEVVLWHQSVRASESMRLSVDGSAYAHDGQSRWGIHIVAGPTHADVMLLCETAFMPPDDLVLMTHDFLQGLATLWRRKTL